MRAKAIATVAAASAALAGGATAAALAPDPASLVVRKSDFPSSAKYNWGRLPANVEQGLASIGVKGSGAYVSVTIPKGTANYESINGMVLTTGSPAQAMKAYVALKADLNSSPRTAQRVAKYGDEQLAVYQSRPGGKAQLIVRRNALVWQLEVAGGGLSKTALLAELQKYATKQKVRVGSG